MGSKHTAAATCLLTKSYSCLRIQALRLTPSNELRPSHATSAAVDYHLRRLNHDSISSTSPQAPLQTNLSTFTPEHSQNGERKGRDRRPVSPTTTTTENRKAQARQHQHNHNHNVTSHPTSPHSVQSQHHFPLHHPHPPVPHPTNIDPPATSPANAPPQTASSKPKTTPPCKSPSAKSTRTAGTQARTRHTRYADSCDRSPRATIALIGWRSGMGF